MGGEKLEQKDPEEKEKRIKARGNLNSRKERKRPK
jgi:hypothetical protein